MSRFFELPGQSCFLFGPRGTGKSTWLRRRLPDALHLDLLEPGLYRSLVAAPERLRELMAGSPRAEIVIVDEVQRVPELLTVVHAVMEEPRPPRFILTGSSARKLRRGGIDLLGGRAVRRTLHPFMAAELPRFDLGAALKVGLLPLAFSAPDPADVLAAYAGTYIDEEVRAEGLTRNVANFTRFLETVSFSHAGQLNVAAVARDCAVERKTAAAYAEILEDLLLAFRLPVFTKRAKRKTTAHPKFYFFDAGVFRAIRPKGPLDRPEEIDGAALEGLVAQHLRAWIAYSHGENDLYFWRTQAGSEIDFVVYGECGILAIEVKNAARVDRKAIRTLQRFRQDYPQAETVLLYRGDKRLRIEETWILPVNEFLQNLAPDRSFADIVIGPGPD